MFETFWQDLRHGIRQLWRSPLFTITAIASIAIGIAGNATIFSLASAVLLRPVPVVTGGDRLVEIGRTQDGSGFDTLSYPNLVDYRDRNTVFDGIAGFRDNQSFGLGFDAGAERVQGAAVSANYFRVLGVSMALGRAFRDDEDRAGAATAVAVLSDRLWRSRFEADPSILGRTIRLNGHPLTVIGVAPRGFLGHNLATSDVWIPLTLRSDLVNGDGQLLTMREGVWLLALGRLRTGVSLDQAQAQMTQIGRDLELEYLQANRGKGIALAALGPLPAQIRGTAAGFIGVLFALVGLILLIACTNVGGMLLARGVTRSREVAVRLALGASRARIVRLLVTESVLLGAAGATVGIGAAVGLIRLLGTLLPVLPVALNVDLRLDWRVVAFSALLAVVAGVLAGLLPALEAARADLTASIKAESAARGGRPLRLRQSFVVAQVAMSVLLVVIALLLARSITNAARIDPGFRIANVDVAVVDLRLGGYDETRGPAFAGDLVSRVEQLPGIRSAASSGVVPLAAGGFALGRLRVPSAPTDGPGIAADWNVISPGYFETIEIPIVRGRPFARTDIRGSVDVPIVNETLAQRVWPERDPIGELLIQEGIEGERTLQVVGVARDAKYRTLGESPRGFVYVPLAQQYRPTLSLLVRRDNVSAIPAIRALVREADPNLPVAQAATLSAMTAFSLVPHRLAGWIAGSVGLIGLLLAAIGVYGIAAHAVTRRTREIGIRVALGALGYQVVGMVVRQSMLLAGIGAVIGLAAAALGTQLLTSLLYGVRSLDPISFAGGAALLTFLALLASLIPARRAARLNPVEALRVE